MDEDVAWFALAKGAASGVDRVNVAKDLPHALGNESRLPTERAIRERHPAGGAGQEPVIAEAAEQAEHLRHRQPAGQPHGAIALVLQIAGTLDVDGAGLALEPPHRPGPAHPGEFLLQ